MVYYSNQPTFTIKTHRTKLTTKVPRGTHTDGPSPQAIDTRTVQDEQVEFFFGRIKFHHDLTCQRRPPCDFKGSVVLNFHLVRKYIAPGPLAAQNIIGVGIETTHLLSGDRITTPKLD